MKIELHYRNRIESEKCKCSQRIDRLKNDERGNLDELKSNSIINLTKNYFLNTHSPSWSSFLEGLAGKKPRLESRREIVFEREFSDDEMF